MSTDRKRKQLMKKYGTLYKRVSPSICSWDNCAYCGEPANCWDHAPAISRLEHMDIKHFISQGGQFNLYPACLQCNGLLGRCPDDDLVSRLTHLEAKYNDKMEQIEVWTEEELNEMGRNMRDFIIAKQAGVRHLTYKAKSVSDRLYDILTGREPSA